MMRMSISGGACCRVLLSFLIGSNLPKGQMIVICVSECEVIRRVKCLYTASSAEDINTDNCKGLMVLLLVVVVVVVPEVKVLLRQATVCCCWQTHSYTHTH